MKETIKYNDVKKEFALNPINLAKIGALDDFHEGYYKIKEVYDKTISDCKKQMETHHKNYWLNDVESYANKEVRKICDKLLNKHHFIFKPGLSRLYTNAYGFKSFTILDVDCRINHENCTYEYTYGYISFEKFLVGFQWAVTRVLYYKIIQSKPKYPLDKFVFEENEYIEKFVEKYKLNQDEGFHDDFFLGEYQSEDEIVNFIESYKKDADNDHEMTNVSLNIYRSLSSVKCYRDHHTIVPEIYYGISVKTGKTVMLPVHHCESCNKYYIGEITYSLYEEIFGALLHERRNTDLPKSTYMHRRPETRLHQYGYVVEEGKLSEKERHRILTLLLLLGYMSYEEINRTIENDINFFQDDSRFDRAVEKWLSDLKYISDFNIKLLSIKNEREKW